MTDPHPTNRWQRLAAQPPSPLLLVLIVLALWGLQSVRRGLWEPDEARFAYVAEEMRTTGSWLVPHRHGEIYAHKPPLMFWLIAAGSTLTGDSEVGRRVASRLPSLLGAFLALLATSRLAARWISPRAAWRVLPVLCGAWLFWHTCGMGQIDALLTGLEMTALWLLFDWNARVHTVGVTRSAARRDWRPALAGIVMGLAVLAKGPVGLLVPLGAYAAASLAAGERRALAALPWLRIVGLALLPVLSWLAACRLVAGAPEAYFREILFTQNVARAGGALGHIRGVSYYVLHAPVEFLPWTLFVPAAWIALGRQPEWRPLRRRLAAWGLFVLFFFSLSASKRNLYVLLAYPAAALLIAAAWDDLTRRRHTIWICSGLLALTAMAVMTGVVAVSLVRELPEGFPRATLRRGLIALAVPALIGCWQVPRFLREPGQRARLLGAFGVLWMFLLAMAGSMLLPALNARKTPAALAAAARAHLPPGKPLLIYRVNGEILALYARARGHRVMTRGELLDAMRNQRQGVAVVPIGDWKQMSGQRLSRYVTAHPFAMGSKVFVWFAFDLDGAMKGAPAPVSPTI